ncbi:cyclophilin-like fold protein [Paraburkholderia phosphatilytica]|uniref:cyclophilin-like fold protein n=1 Tax=Paraburkholderia phosphatilytica TaxID=2282883 RepID=UPI000E48C17D|nr:cyclophilin-like fold protein [Paraburkholderia phosphatilytica]
MKIRFDFNGARVTASLEDNATSRDFITMLPLAVRLEDFAATEKIAYLPQKLDTAGAPSGVAPDAGDVAYYVPWGNLAVFHADFRYSPSLVKFGHVDHGLAALRTAGSAEVVIEREED